MNQHNKPADADNGDSRDTRAEGLLDDLLSRQPVSAPGDFTRRTIARIHAEAAAASVNISDKVGHSPDRQVASGKHGPARLAGWFRHAVPYVGAAAAILVAVLGLFIFNNANPYNPGTPNETEVAEYGDSLPDNTVKTPPLAPLRSRPANPDGEASRYSSGPDSEPLYAQPPSLAAADTADTPSHIASVNVTGASASASFNDPLPEELLLYAESLSPAEPFLDENSWDILAVVAR